MEETEWIVWGVEEKEKKKVGYALRVCSLLRCRRHPVGGIIQREFLIQESDETEKRE